MKQIFLITGILCFLAFPCLAGQAKIEVKKGNLLYNKGDFKEALKRYEKALSDSPDSDVVNFDLGTALYKTRDFEKSIAHFEKSLVSENKSLEQKASYNLGNAEYKYGISKENENLPKAVELLKQSLRHYERAFELDAEDDDAKYNYEFVKKELKRLEEKLKQQSSADKTAKDKQMQSQEENKKSESEQRENRQQKAEEQKAQEEQKESKQDRFNAEENASGEKSGQEQQQSVSEEKERQSERVGSQEEKDNKERASEQTAQAQQTKEEMSEKEAVMLLDSYRHEEEPKGLYKENIPNRQLPEASKDW